MISINRSNINDLVDEHFDAIKSHFDHKDAIISYDSIDEWFKNNGLRVSFEEVIKAKASDLPIIKNSYRRLSWRRNPNPYPSKIQYIKNELYTKRFSKSSSYLRGGKYNAAQLVKKLEITVCPYCNRNYINNASRPRKGTRRTSQMDHFYGATKFPFLAMSFFNLIPSCAACNLLKSAQSIDYSPYNLNYDSSDLFNFDLHPSSYVDVHDLSRIKLLFSNKDDIFKKNIDTFFLESQYEVHSDVVQDLMIKSKMYTPEKIKEMKNDFMNLNFHEEDFYRILFGNYMEEENLYKRPLSKLTKDIINTLYYP